MEFLHFLAGIRNFGLDIFFTICTAFGEELVLIGIFAVIYWCVNKKLAYKIAFSYFISGIAIQTAKLHFRIERPWILDSSFQPVESAVEGATGYSFPSGHTQSSTSLYSTLALHFKKRGCYILFFALIALVMLSRMYLGCHTPLDVCASFLITIVTAFIVSYLYENFNGSALTDILIVAAIEILALASVIYEYHLVASGVTTAELAMDGFKMAGSSMGFALAWYLEKKFVRFSPKAYHIGIQIGKVIFGLLIALVIKSGLKLVFGDTILMNVLRYFLVILWIGFLYPLCIKKIINDRN